MRALDLVVSRVAVPVATSSWRGRHPLGHVDRDLRVLVTEVVEEAEAVRTLRFARPDGEALPPWDPGAHVDLVLPTGRMRQYSLTGEVDDLSSYRIGVRRIDPAAGGGLGSVEAHTLSVGDRVTLRGPRNAFPFIPSPAGYLFVAGGIGITPILPMVRDAVRRSAPFAFVYTGRTRASMPFLDELATIAGSLSESQAQPQSVHVWPDDEHGVPDPDRLLELAPAGAALYCCGPMPMIDAIRRVVPAPVIDTLHYERFSPPPVLGGDAFTLRLAASALTVAVAADESALSAVRRARPGQAYSCQQGFCGTCRVRVLTGEVEHRDHVLTEDERAGHMMLCVSRGRGEIVLDL
jgi:ferredoxin-NADP reductase